MIILGIDPGYTLIGIGFIEKSGGKFSLIDCFLLNVKKTKDKGERLVSIEKELKRVLKKTRPDRAGVEKIFFSKNHKTAMEVSEARGVIIKTLAELHIPLFELAPLQVKASVSGNGFADKKTIEGIVKKILGIKKTKKISDDVSDALALAIVISEMKKELSVQK